MSLRGLPALQRPDAERNALGTPGPAGASDICQPCQSFWFDARESASLAPAATLALFRIIGARVARPRRTDADLANCSRCHARLRRTHDLQRPRASNTCV